MTINSSQKNNQTVTEKAEQIIQGIQHLLRYIEIFLKRAPSQTKKTSQNKSSSQPKQIPLLPDSDSAAKTRKTAISPKPQPPKQLTGSLLGALDKTLGETAIKTMKAKKTPNPL